MRRDRSDALDHVVLVLFENRSFDNPGLVPSEGQGS
jgi:hypothetical protein